ncbi:unnamed protein product, partial [Brenthis ino]
MNINFEDTIQCFYFSEKKLSKDEWGQLCYVLNETLTSLSQNYIWHRDEFKIVLPITISREEGDYPDYLMSITCFGDNIEDEWFIVHLLLELTKRYTDLIVKIEDNDGDFLMIEAANYLPAWVNPDNTENRVFIYKGEIHLIPPTIVSIPSTLKLNEAIEIIIQRSSETKASSDIQEVILKRVSFCSEISKHFHKAVLNLPVDIAAVLTLKPSLISALVTTYCNADALEVKHYKDIHYDDCVRVEVLFSKYLYAMLMNAKFPNIRKLKQFELNKMNQLGVKLTCGYKTIMNKASKDIFATSEYQKFLNSLTNNGYFKDNIEGSKDYNQLLDKAKDYFYTLECPINSYVSNQISDIILSPEFDKVKENIKQKCKMSLFEEDSDDWLNIQPDELNEFLNTQYGNKVKIKKDEPITSVTITNKLSNFLKESSDFEGIEQTRSEAQDDNNIEFDSDEFVNCLEKMLNIISKDSDITPSDRSDFSDDDDDDGVEVSPSEQDLELASKLKSTQKSSASNNSDVLQNLIQSMKEEGLSGPSSTVLRTIGVKKSDLLDSDDDDIENTE